MRSFYFFAIALLFNTYFFAQTPQRQNAAEIFESIKKLNFLGSVLYVAAHPDDENTNLIAYFANHVHAQTAYISLTRGDGGQNLIGPELKETLGVIRTQELLKARQIDGGKQFFSRAIDFGYSKNPKETFGIWNKEEVLSDLVYVIRQFQPDVIINRFDHRSPGTTHGHHTASAMLSLEAFDMANDPKRFAQQLNLVKTWQPKRLFFNPSWFFYGSHEAFEKADKSNYFKMDIGVYYPSLGLSNSEIAAKSRSQHSSQGFGETAIRGESLEYLELLKGEKFNKNIFEGIDTTWNRIEGGQEIGEILSKVESDFDFKNPSKSIPELLKAYQLIQKLKDDHWREIKLEEIKEIIYHCAGLFLEAVSTSPYTTADEKVNVKIEAINRSEIPIELTAIESEKISQKLKENQAFYTEKTLTEMNPPKPTSPYWLDEKGSLGIYEVNDQKLIGLPETPAPYNVNFVLKIAGQEINYQKSVVYKYNDAVNGETYKPFVVVPKASVHVEEKVLIFTEGNSKKIGVKVKSFSDNLKGDLSLKAEGWRVVPESQPVTLDQKEEEKTFWFEVFPPKNESESDLIPQLKVGEDVFANQLVELNYSHIPDQNILQSGGSKIVHLAIQKKGHKIGYIVGAGDSIPENLRQIGYQVELIAPEEITAEHLKAFDAVVLGIRAFNVVPEMAFSHQLLFEYVKNGGNLIVQYNTNHALVTQEIAPFPLSISRDRVTDEHAQVEFIHPTHAALNTPNRITEKDFEGWIQERGLYFPNQWDKAFEPILSMKDEGEKSSKGSILIASYGKGFYVYTGLSFFRQLPEGVPGAYRLLANLLSLGQS